VYHIALEEPKEGEKTWQITVLTGKKERAIELTTMIALSTPTETVVKLLLKLYRHARITGPGGQQLNPRPPDGYPAIHSSQS
jgi:hypothetical protein